MRYYASSFGCYETKRLKIVFKLFLEGLQDNYNFSQFRKHEFFHTIVKHQSTEESDLLLALAWTRVRREDDFFESCFDILVASIIQNIGGNALTMQRLRYISFKGLQRQIPFYLGLSGKATISQMADDLIRAGKRRGQWSGLESIDDCIADECLHFAISYRQIGKNDKVSIESAKKVTGAVKVIYNCKESSITFYRFWLDQNLHHTRPPESWDEVGILPYVCLPCVVVSSVAGRETRPWLWVEHVLSDRYKRFQGGFTSSDIKELKKQALSVMAVWNPQLLNDQDYEYAKHFKEAVQWAKTELFTSMDTNEW